MEKISASKSGLWLDWWRTKAEQEELRQKLIQASLQTALSRRSATFSLPNLPLVQVKKEPDVGK